MIDVPVLIWITCRNYENYLPQSLMSAHCQTVRCCVGVAHDRCGLPYPSGVCIARNAALKSSFSNAAQYIVFLDADDMLPTDYVEKLYESAAHDPVVVACPAQMFEDDDGRVIPDFPVTCESLLKRNSIHCSAMIAVELLRKFGGYNKSLTIWEDWELWTRFAFNGVEFRLRSDTQLFYRRHKGSRNDITDATRDRMKEHLAARYGTKS